MPAGQSSASALRISWYERERKRREKGVRDIRQTGIGVVVVVVVTVVVLDAHSAQPPPFHKKTQTYGNTIDFTPGPALNLVIGPNGAGKSSLVCAICIGLGGAPSLLGEFFSLFRFLQVLFLSLSFPLPLFSRLFFFFLAPSSSPTKPLPHKPTTSGRARELSEYVRRGAQAGWVEVTLASGSPRVRDTVIRRDLRAADSKSEWTVNGVRQSRAADAAEQVRALSIQLDNLCQFLPQDRVSEFARLSPPALLVETQRASGGGACGGGARGEGRGEGREGGVGSTLPAPTHPSPHTSLPHTDHQLGGQAHQPARHVGRGGYGRDHPCRAGRAR